MTTAAAMPRRQRRFDDYPPRRIAELIGAASIEVSPGDGSATGQLNESLAPGRTVFVNHPGNVSHHDIVAACVRLRRAGFLPMPHLAARRLASFAQARDFVQRVSGETEVAGVMLIAGDPAQPAGPFRDSLDLLATGLLERHGIGHVAFACYPAGHPRIARRDLERTLHAKIASARKRGLNVSLITQFGFAPEPIERMIGSLRDDGISCPIRIGVAGPAAVATLAKFAVRWAPAAALHALGRGETALARALTVISPDGLIESLAMGADRAAPIDGLHVFTFGGVRLAASWLDGVTGRGQVRVQERAVIARNDGVKRGMACRLQSLNEG